MQPVRVWIVPRTLDEPPQPSEVVVCGPVGAVWRVVGVREVDAAFEVELEPVDPHDVPPTSRVRELPMPVGTVPAAGGDTGTADDGREQRTTVGNTEGIPGHGAQR